MNALLKQAAIAGTAGAIVLTVWLSTSARYFPLTKVDFERGHQLFQDRCATCHAVDETSVAAFGPNLSQIGEAAAHRVPQLSAEEFLLQSIVDPNAYRTAGNQGVMPADISAGLKPRDVLSLIGFLMTRGGQPDGRRLLGLLHKVRVPQSADTETIDLAAVEAGKLLFLGKGNCAKCHVLRDLPGHNLRAPSLLHAGSHDVGYLRDAIRDPSKHLSPGYGTWTVYLASGQMVTGRLLRRTETSLSMLADSNGVLKLVELPHEDIDVEDDGTLMVVPSPQSPMPQPTPDFLTDVEVEQLVAFLKAIR